MTTVHTVTTATHTAYLDPMTGSGLLVCPDPANDAHGPSLPGRTINDVQTIASGSLHATDWDAMMRRLTELGWTPLDNPETGELLCDGETRDGRTVIALYGDDPVITNPSMGDLATAGNDIRSVASFD